MIDGLFPDNLAKIDVQRYVETRKAEFDKLGIQKLPNYMLIQKIQQVGFIILLLENNNSLTDGSDKRYLLTEFRRQAVALATEYNWRVENDIPGINSLVKTLLGDNIQLGEPPHGQVVGMKTLDLTGRASGGGR